MNHVYLLRTLALTTLAPALLFDVEVRDTAIRYFHASTTPDSTLMPLAIQAMEK